MVSRLLSRVVPLPNGHSWLINGDAKPLTRIKLLDPLW